MLTIYILRLKQSIVGRKFGERESEPSEIRVGSDPRLVLRLSNELTVTITGLGTLCNLFTAR